VHSAYFASLDEIADAKAEIFAGMDSGFAVLNRDSAQFDRLARAAESRGLKTLSFATAVAADVHVVRARPDGDGSDVVADVAGETLQYRIGVPGSHWVANSLAVLATVLALGADVAGAARGLSAMRAPDGRGRRHRIAAGGGTIEIIDESYNASPVSMAAALEVLGRTRPEAGGRRIAVLGDMLELGDDAPARHRGLIEQVVAQSVDLVFTAGPMMGRLWEALPTALRGGHAPDSDTLAPLVAAAVRAGDVAMVKGSAGSRTGVVVAALLALDGRDETAPRRVVNGE
jgi:UDP-N-acetylmuramoyl-tripeptide--D-alanyl-D-alanine ligase